VVTYNHQRSIFELLLADATKHFQTLAQTPADVLRHIGSPFAPEKDVTQCKSPNETGGSSIIILANRETLFEAGR
jgi:hypothetical protein